MTCNNISEITYTLVSETHGKYIVAKYIRDRPVLSQRANVRIYICMCASISVKKLVIVDTGQSIRFCLFHN